MAHIILCQWQTPSFTLSTTSILCQHPPAFILFPTTTMPLYSSLGFELCCILFIRFAKMSHAVGQMMPHLTPVRLTQSWFRFVFIFSYGFGDCRLSIGAGIVVSRRWHVGVVVQCSIFAKSVNLQPFLWWIIRKIIIKLELIPIFLKIQALIQLKRMIRVVVQLNLFWPNLTLAVNAVIEIFMVLNAV